jgi:hypothetical protein
MGLLGNPPDADWPAECLCPNFFAVMLYELSHLIAAGLSSLLALPAPLPSAPPPPPFAPPPPPTEEVRFLPAEAGLTLNSQTGVIPVEQVRPLPYGWAYERVYAPAYSPLCTGPCTLRMTPGVYSLALSKGVGPPVLPVEPVVIGGPAALRAQYIDRSGARVAGAVIALVGGIGGTIMVIASVGREDVCNPFGCYRRDTVDGPLMAGGIGIVVASAVVGSILITQHDAARIAVTPLASPLVGPRKESGPLDAATSAQGAALTLRF